MPILAVLFACLFYYASLKVYEAARRFFDRPEPNGHSEEEQ